VLRILIVLVSLAGAVAFALEYREEDRCADARNRIVETRGAQTDAIDTLRSDCRGTQARIDAAGALRAAGRPDQALVLAREAVEEEPDNPRAWRAVSVLATGSERSAARARLRELDPRSLKRRTGRSTR
jgi:Tetratricopeptide repeat